MSRILVPRRPSPGDGAHLLDLRRIAVRTRAKSAKPSSPMLQQAPIRPEIAAKLAIRFGYPVEFWLNLGKRDPTDTRSLGPSTPTRNSLILPSDFPRR
jgi:hypothetical protein